jgi:phospholipid-binding lipoprotein MlaA
MQRGLDGGVTRPPVFLSPTDAPAGRRRCALRRGGRHAAVAVVLALAFAAGAARAADTPPGVRDPFERLNRATYAFNDALDRMLAKPAARTYKAVVPGKAREAVSNFLGNLDYPTTALNDALQGKLRAAGHDVARFVVNSTVGIGGLLDPATRWGLTANDEDFGQTLGVWGVGPGPYLVLPFLGPSDCRDAPARFVDRYTNVAYYARPTTTQYYVLAAELLDRRTALLAADAAVEAAFDPYTFVRNSYLQRREYRVRDGNMPEENFDDELPGEAAAGAPAAPAKTAPAPPPGAGPTTAAPAAMPDSAPTAAPAAAAPGVSAEPPPPAASPPPR